MMSVSHGDPPEPSFLSHHGPDPVRFVAPDYTRWTVHEVHDPGTAGGRSLIFVSPAGFRRVRQFPDDWRTLTDRELWVLSWER